jgi:hypothetical protein
VIQEANAATAASDRLGLLDGDTARNLQLKLKEYVRARIDLYRMPHDFSFNAMDLKNGFRNVETDCDRLHV